MLDPSGPLPPAVYWRRRAVAAGAAVLGVLLLVWVVSGLVGDDGGGGNGDPNGVPAAAVHPLPPKPAPTSPPPSSKPATSGTATSTSTSKPTTTTSKPPLTCANAAISVSAQVGARQYRVGQHPLLKIVIGNAGQVPCRTDIGRGLRELVVVSGDGVRRLWSSNDCDSGTEAHNVRVLQPGQRVSFSITWAGRTSATGCPAQRSAVPKGDYLVVAKLGGRTGGHASLRLV